MKKFLKIAGVLFLGAIGIGLIWYFQSLKVEGEPLLTACWGVEVYDDLTGEKVVGVEDLDFDPESGTIFMSAYDRRAVAREIEAGKVTTQGGIYTLQVSDITDATSLQVTDISRDFKEAGNEFRPHGFELGGGLLSSINRVYQTNEGENLLKPEIVYFIKFDGVWRHLGTEKPENICDPYDVILITDGIALLGLYTDVTGNCDGGWGQPKGAIKKGDEIVLDNLSFPNGIVRLGLKEIVVTETGNSSVKFFDLDNPNDQYDISLPIAPDNLTVGMKNNLYVAGFPNLLDYYFYMNGWLGVEKSPSAAYRISPEDYALELLFKDNGTMISGATVALRAGDYLILGSGWDDNIAICSGMDEFD